MNATWKWLKEFNKQGVVEWDGITSYDIDDITKGSNGFLYSSLANANVNFDPTLEPTKWEVSKRLTDGAQTILGIKTFLSELIVGDGSTTADVTLRANVSDNARLNFKRPDNKLVARIYWTYATDKLMVRKLDTDGITVLSDFELNDGIGKNQAWSDQSANRVSGTTYTNSTGRPIQVVIGGYLSGSNQAKNVFVDGVAVMVFYGDLASTNRDNLSFIVPNGSTYSASFTSDGGFWSELR
jgi:hypothetical protein